MIISKSCGQHFPPHRIYWVDCIDTEAEVAEDCGICFCKWSFCLLYLLFWFKPFLHCQIHIDFSVHFQLDQYWTKARRSSRHCEIMKSVQHVKNQKQLEQNGSCSNITCRLVLTVEGAERKNLQDFRSLSNLVWQLTRNKNKTTKTQTQFKETMNTQTFQFRNPRVGFKFNSNSIFVNGSNQSCWPTMPGARSAAAEKKKSMEATSSIESNELNQVFNLKI